jgi:hypothetical protein
LVSVQPANAVTVSNGNCSAEVSVNTGVKVYSESGYCYVAFTSTSATPAWTVPSSVTSISYIVVAGGGGGATRHAGGGGGGGVVTGTLAVSSGETLTARVGAGGAGAIASAWIGSGYPLASNGDTSTLTKGVTVVTAIGGGAGHTLYVT